MIEENACYTLKRKIDQTEKKRYIRRILRKGVYWGGILVIHNYYWFRNQKHVYFNKDKMVPGAWWDKYSICKCLHSHTHKHRGTWIVIMVKE